MPRDSSGTYTTPVNTVDPAVSGTTIGSADFNSLTADLTTEMTDSLDRSGKGAMLAALAMGGFKITNVGAPVATTDAARKADLTLGGDVTGTLAANTVSNIAGTAVTGTTGTGKAVLQTVPTITTPLLTGLTAGVSPAAGNIGEVLSSTASGNALTSGVTQNMASVSLTAGNWLIMGGINVTGAGGAIFTQVSTALSNASGAFSGAYGGTRQDDNGLAVANVTWNIPCGSVLKNVTGATIVYLLSYTAFSSGTAAGGGTISALRVS